MDIETRKRIRAYKRALPQLRERVVAVALLLAMSASMLASASFAWLTISRRPEVTGVSTTVAANGNLEIALATSEDKPNESAVGDSSATEGQSVTAANVTWGNLVNLSDPSYGLDNLTLRPAQLNTASLLTSPLFGAVFTKDGRVERLTSNFSYTSWVPSDGTLPGYFGLANKLGVRAISSTKVEALGFQGTYLTLKDTASSSNAQAAGMYNAITENESWMTALANMMGIHMTASLNSEDKYKNAEVDPADLQALIDMYGAFIDAFEQEAQAMAELLNLELFVAHGGDTTKYQTFNSQAVLAAVANSGNDFVAARVDQADGAQKVVKITNLKTFLKDYNMLVTNKAKMETINANGDRRWNASGLQGIVNQLVNINQCLIQFSGEGAKTVTAFLNEMSSNPINALGYRNQACTATITNGVLYNFDQRVGAGISVTKDNTGSTPDGLPITAKMYVSTAGLGEQEAKVYATIVTSATIPSEFTQDLGYAESLNTGAGSDVGEVTAEDTYGLAIDLWVRTNADESYLTLEGNVLTKEEEIDAKGKDSNGNEVQLYTLNRTSTNEETGESVTTTYNLYQTEKEIKNEDGTTTTSTVWYNADTYAQFDLQENEKPNKKKEIRITVIGFEGENRVWNSDEDKIKLSTDATTQGSGSCYVYYADTPEDQARSLELLKAMHVAFIDANGKLLASAAMDTSSSYEESGRVIVPLVLEDGQCIEVSDGDNSVRAITRLEKNVPLRITAIVYLDGTSLSNENVLSASEIQGQLNIQFGSNIGMEPIRNETLETAERRVSASVDPIFFNFDTDTNLTSTVRITVTGDQPENVSAFFIRKINDSQGSREPVMDEFRQNADGVWECDYTFTAPGVYILRTVELDGQEYPLPYDEQNPLPTVTVKGFSVESLTCSQAAGNKINIMSASNSATVDLKLKFASSDQSKMPRTVQGRFLKGDGTAVNINFTYNASGSNEGYWTGSATFLSSGEYTFQYLVLNGEYAELPTSMWQTASIKLGMRVAVYTNGNTGFKYLPSEMGDNEKILGMFVTIMDNSGAELPGLQGARLTYGLTTGGARVMDTDLTWDASQGYYIGELKALESGGPGTWVFKNVTVSGNTLPNATTSPTFTMFAPEPPSFDSLPNTKDYEFSPDGNAFMPANLKYSATATVLAVITDANGQEYEVQGKLNSTDMDTNISNWHFTIPDNADDTQDGYWTMKELRVWNYYKADGSYVNAEVDANGELVPDGERDNPMVIDMLGRANGQDYTVKVVETFTLRFNPNEGNTSRTGDNAFTGAFLDTHSFSGVNFDLYDFEGEALPNVSGTLAYKYDGGTFANGGYTTGAASANNEYFSLAFAAGNAPTNFVQGTTQSLQYAGNYTPFSLRMVIDGKAYTYAAGSAEVSGAPSFTVKSAVPVVKVTATDPKPGTVKRVYTVKAPTTSAQAIQGDFFSYSDYRATVYIHTPAQGGGYDQEAAEAYAPTVTLGLSGVPAGYTNASMVFTTANSDSNSSTFTFTNGTATAPIGKAVAGARGWFGVDDYPECYPAGTMTQNKLSITYNNATYEVTLDNAITIDQPQSPTALVFAGIPDSYTGARPAQVIGKGTEVTVTLPEYSWTATIEEPKDGTWSAYTSVGEVADVNGNKTKALSYTSWVVSGRCGDTTYYTYQYFTWTKFQSSITASTDIYTQAKKIDRWIINGKTYKAGTTVTVTGNGILTATAVVSDNGAKTFVETKNQTTYKYLYGYVAENKVTKTEDPPDLTVNVIGTVGGKENAALSSVKTANVTNADAATDKPGTNTTSDAAAYNQFWP